MKFNLNEFLISVSFALDFVEMDIVGSRTNHGKRVAYNSILLGKALELDNNDLIDIVSIAILHGNGISEYAADNFNNKHDLVSYEKVKQHCTIGEENVMEYPFLKDETKAILYHHEYYDGTGYFKLKGDEIPLMAQIIGFSDYMDNTYKLNKLYGSYKDKVIKELKEISGIKYSKRICDSYLKIIKNANYRLDQEDYNINEVLQKKMPKKSINLSLKEIRDITKVFSNIIDSKSKFTRRHSKGLAEKAALMGDYYNFNEDEKIKFVIAADLHDLGKLAIPNSILDAQRKLTNDEFALIESHTYYTRRALSKIHGFEEITEWASNHHEKLNGLGYPYGKTAQELDFNSRLMGCLDIYQALTEERPYRTGLSHEQAMDIMHEMVNGGFIDSGIVNDINIVFS